MKVTVNKNTNKKDFMDYLDFLCERNENIEHCGWNMTTKKHGENQLFEAELRDKNHVPMFLIKIQRFHPMPPEVKVERFKDVNGYIVNPLKK